MQIANPPLIHRAKGCYLYGEEGQCYLDAISSWWVNLHGHAHPYIAEKIGDQAQLLEHVIFADFTHPPAIELASRLLALLPSTMSKIFYSDNGSTAIEVALKLAIQFWYNQGKKKHKVICFKKSFHGETFGAMSASGKNDFNRPFWSHLFEVEAIDPPMKEAEELSYFQLESILQKGDAACFIFEPLILGAGGMIIYPPEGLDHLLSLCQRYDVLTIADEVMTGFGRTGTLFACNQLKNAPDLICLSKGITGGFLPLAATACTERIYNAFLGDDMRCAFLHGHSYTANPIGCSSALASLDLLLDGACIRQRETIAKSHQSFCKKGHPQFKRCESIGTILVVEYHTSESSYFHSMRNQLYHFFLSRGIFLRPLGNVLYVMPPYCIKVEQLQEIYDQIIKSLEVL